MTGTIQLTIISAKLTHDTETFGKMDPYCVLKLKSTSFKTKTHQDAGKFPAWNQVFNIRTDQVGDVLELEVWDEDTLSKDDLIGIGFFSVPYLVSALEQKEAWFPLTYKDKKAGEVLIAHQFFPDGKPASNIQVPPQNQPPQYQPPQYPSPQYPSPQYQLEIQPLTPQIQPSPYQPFPPVQPNQQPFEPPMNLMPSSQLHPVQPPFQPPVEEFKQQINGLVFEHKVKLDGFQNMNQLYYKTNIQHPLNHVEKIVIFGESKDQGHSFQNDSSSWIEVSIVDHQNEDQTERITVFKNFRLSNYEKWNFSINDPFFLKEVKKHGNQVALYARSIGQEWICEIKECRVEIHTGQEQGQIPNQFGPKQKTYHFEKKEKLHGRENMNELYLKTQILDKILEVEEIEIEGKTKDQGFASVPGSNSWIEAVVVKENGEELVERKTVFENYKFSEWKEWKEKIHDHNFLQALKHHGAQIQIYARSKYPGWICEVKEIEVKIKCLVE